MKCFANFRSGTQPYRDKLGHFTTEGTQIILVVHAYWFTIVEVKKGIVPHKNTKTGVEQSGIGRKEGKL